MNIILHIKTSGLMLPWCLLILYIVLTIDCALISKEENYSNPNVRILQGNLQGKITKTRRNRDVYSFQSIPYAEPPVGYLRFKKPVPARSWIGTLIGTTESNVCPQLLNGVFTGNEDCLYLNVYTPQLPILGETGHLPVMVYIHGGGFERGNGGSALYGPRYILDEDVVLVTINYRLGPLGFLSTGDELVPGNNGLKDQVLALKWVQNNIRYFGGDPQKVTIFGQSTGGCSTHLLALSNSTFGLFHRYISQSGSAFSIRAYRPRNIYKNRAFELGGHVGCPTNTSKRLVSCLMGLDVRKIIESKPLFNVWRNFPDIIWGATDEPNIYGAFLTDSPGNIYATGRIRGMPWIAGDVENSGLLLSGDFYANPAKFDDFLAHFDDVLPYIVQYDHLSNVTSRTAALKAYYFNNDLSSDKSAILSNFTQLLSDAFFIFPIYNSLEKQLSLAKAPEYFYSFEYRGTFSYSNSFTNGSTSNYGAVHNDERVYLFSETETLFGLPDTIMSVNDFKIVDAMVQLWTTFATNGTPITSVSDETLTWGPYSPLHNYLRIGKNSDATLSIQYHFLSQRMQFWEELTRGERTEVSSRNAN